MLNQLKDGQAGKWNRTGSRIYIKSLDFIEDDNGGKHEKYDLF